MIKRALTVLTPLLLVSSVWAQKPNPKAPTITTITPIGVQPGSKVTVTITGKNLASPTGVWTSSGATASIPTDKNNGKSATSLRVVLDVPKDATMGAHLLRVSTTQGMSTGKVFCIDSLPTISESRSNHSLATAQPIKAPCVIDGYTDGSQRDYFRFTAKAGERLSFDVLARRIGSPLDPQITLYHAESGREVGGAHSSDAKGLQTDARLTWRFEEAGDYIVQVRDVLYRGGGTYQYRLRVGDFPCATTPIPLAAQRGSKVTLQFAGSQTEGITETIIVPKSDQAAIQVTPKSKTGLAGWPVSLLLSDTPEAVEKEPNDDSAKATRIAVPGAASGRFLTKGDRDTFVFTAKKGKRLKIDAMTQRLFSPTEVYLTIRDAKGKQLLVSNPAKAPTLSFAPPADGDYFLTVEHLHYWFGPEESYRIVIDSPIAGFALEANLDRFDAVQGKPFTVAILTTRQGHKGPIEVSVIGNPALSGKVTIKPGIPKKAGAAGANLQITVKAGTPPGPLTFQIQGTATISGKTFVTKVEATATVKAMMANLPFPPTEFLTNLAVAVKSK